MTMATVAYKQGIILERFWTALRLRRSKGPGEASNLTKRPNNFWGRRKEVYFFFFGKTVFHLGTTITLRA